MYKKVIAIKKKVVRVLSLIRGVVIPELVEIARLSKGMFLAMPKLWQYGVAVFAIFVPLLLGSVMFLTGGYSNVGDAIKYGTVKDVRYFVEKGKKEGNTIDLDVIQIFKYFDAPYLRPFGGGYGGYDPTYITNKDHQRWIAIIKYLVKEGAKLNEYNHSALYYAIDKMGAGGVRENDILDMCKFLIEHGADVNVYMVGDHTPLGEARKHRFKNLEIYLIVNGADAVRGKTPLHVLLSSDIAGEMKEQWVRQFIEKGTDVNAKDDEGKTPLHVLLRDRGLDESTDEWTKRIAKYLIEKGADVKVKDNRGLMPLHKYVSLPESDKLRQLRSTLSNLWHARGFFNHNTGTTTYSSSEIRNIRKRAMLIEEIKMEEIRLKAQEEEMNRQIQSERISQ